MIFAIRPMRTDDVGAVTAIAAIVPTAPHWPEFEYRRMLRITEEQPGTRGAWVAIDGAARLGGFAMASQVAGVVELEAVVTAPDQRRQGIGRALTEAVLGWACSLAAERVVLEARMSNVPALGLYVRFGFQQDGIRRGYYRNSDEDAVLLSLRIGSELNEAPSLQCSICKGGCQNDYSQ